MVHMLTPAKSAAVSAKVLALVSTGISPIDALRQVCGAATVDAMIGEVYHALRGEDATALKGVLAGGTPVPGSGATLAARIRAVR
jgi:hypothetical protein